MHEEEDDDAKATEIFKPMWLEPVASLDDLPTDGIAEGVRCFVQEEDANYVFLDDEWFRMKTRPSG